MVLLRKKACPYCGKYIFVRSGKLVTEEQAQILDWLVKLEPYGVTKKQFEQERKNLSRQFGKTASIDDTVWRILNELSIEYSNDPFNLEWIRRLQSSKLAQEGRDPTTILRQAEKTRSTRPDIQEPVSKKIFLGLDEIAYARKLRNDGKLDKVQEFLESGEPSAAVLDELRKTCGAKAKEAKKNNDWQGVVNALEYYETYAQKWRDRCIELVNQEPPEHTMRDKKLLARANKELTNSD